MMSGLAVPAGPAFASCAPPPAAEEAVRQSDLVFVGTVAELANRDRWAVFTVEQVWKGDPGGARVDVRAGPAEPGDGTGVATSVDRTYQLGTRYLVFARAVSQGSDAVAYGPGARWSDNACSLTQPYDPSLDRLRPATVEPPDRTPPSGPGSPGGPGGPEAPTAPPGRTSQGEGIRPWAWVPGVLTLAIVLGVIFIPHKGRAKEPPGP